jgi:PASTA domain
MSVVRNVLATFLGGVLIAMMISTHLKAQSVARMPAPKFIPMDPIKGDIKLGYSPSTVLVQTNVSMQAGDMRRVFGRAEIASSVNSSALAVAFVECTTLDGSPVSQEGGTNQNHEGRDTPIGASYPYPGELALYPSLLFKAPYAGTFTCKLEANGDPNNPLTAIASDYDGYSTTWLQVSAQPDAGVNYAGAFWWQNLPCDEQGKPNPQAPCVYLGGASGQQQVYEFENDGSPVQSWQAPEDAAFVDASDSLMVTTCYYDTGSCTADNSESWWNHIFDNPGGSVVQSHLELIQLNPDESVCNTTASPDQISNVGNAPHHYMIYHSLADVPVYPCNGSRLFKLRIFVKYLSGNPVKIDGSSYGAGKSTFTHAYAFKSSSGTAFPIPYLIGLTENEANDAIAASGYAVLPVSSSLSTAPAGTVISQNPPAGIINYPGTGVAFTVSTGGATVPNLLGHPESSAIGTITALGLVPSVSFTKACINPGDVLTQSPLSGTVVPPGSTVSITVDSGTRQTCILK